MLVSGVCKREREKMAQKCGKGVFGTYLRNVRAGSTDGKGRLSTVDLLIRVPCLLKIMCLRSKSYDHLNHMKEVNCTEPSPSISVPW